MKLYCLITVYFVYTDCVLSLLNSDNISSKSVHLVIEEEGEHGSGSQITDSARKQQELLCSSGSVCIPLSRCTVMSQLLTMSCLQTDKLNGLKCGFTASEPMVCCPQSCTVGQEPGAEKCGQPKLHNWWSATYTGVGSQPWAARVGFLNKYTQEVDYLCSGSIISKQVVLTAAHCALAKSVSHKISSVLVGEYDSNSNPDCTSTFCAHSVANIPLSHIIVHPGYDSKTYRHNIAILVLKEPMNYSLAIQPICLYPRGKHYTYTGTSARLVGWGKLAGQSEVQNYQQQLVMPILPLERCASLYSASVPITTDELCVGGDVGKDACSGFGGAPLVLLDPDSKARYYQIGLMSFGSDKCGAAGVPSVYTRIDHYSEWIGANSPKQKPQ